VMLRLMWMSSPKYRPRLVLRRKGPCPHDRYQEWTPSEVDVDVELIGERRNVVCRVMIEWKASHQGGM